MAERTSGKNEVRRAPVALDQGISTRSFEDRAGLGSPGRWQPEARVRAPIAAKKVFGDQGAGDEESGPYTTGPTGQL